MKLDSNLLNEAIADAKAVKETAVQTAIGKLKEAFEPTVRQLITQKLSEEEDEDITSDPTEMEEEYSEDTYDLVDDLTEEDDDDMYESEEEDDMDLDEILAELEGELEDEPIEEEDDMDDMDDMDDEPIEEEEDFSEEDLDEILAELEGEMDDEEDEAPAPEVQAENRRLRKELTETKNHLKKAYRAITTQKNAINEVNLLNSKLLFLTKITNAYQLSPEKQIKILEAFDRAQTIREVKLVYTTVCESISSSNKTKNKRSIVESASRPIRSVKRNLNENYDFASRWKELAGIK